MIRKIIQHGHPILNQKGEEIKDFNNPDVHQLIKDLIETLTYTNSGVGLAANQIGVPKRIFIIHYPEKNIYNQVFINPRIKEYLGEKETMTEGCLSIPNTVGIVSRYSKVRVEYEDENGITHEKTFISILSRIFQHEYDHTIGKLFLERVSTHQD